MCIAPTVEHLKDWNQCHVDLLDLVSLLIKNVKNRRSSCLMAISIKHAIWVNTLNVANYPNYICLPDLKIWKAENPVIQSCLFT